MMKTLTEITQADEARKRRALDYENALRRRDNLQVRVKRLQSQGRADVISKLETILELTAQIPEDVQASLGGLVPLAGVARTFIYSLASSALANVKRADETRQQQLLDAQKELRVAETALASITENE